MNSQKNQSEQWKLFALLFKNAMEAQGLNSYNLSKKVGCSPSTLTRFFNLEFCLRFDYILKIVNELNLNIFFETREDSQDLNKWFEDAMEKLGRRPDKLPKN